MKRMNYTIKSIQSCPDHLCQCAHLFPLASTVFQDYFRPYDLMLCGRGLLALWLLQAPACSLISGSAGVSQWLWRVTLLPTAGLRPRVRAELIRTSAGKGFRSML